MRVEAQEVNASSVADKSLKKGAKDEEVSQ
jgi:hypothetical protein